jgi:tetratricopeptide (TPR) repeat protein
MGLASLALWAILLATGFAPDALRAEEADSVEQAVMLARAARLPEAAAILERLLARAGDPMQIIRIRMLLGDVYAAGLRLENAVRQYDEVLKVAPQLAAAHFKRGEALAMTRRHEEAIAALRRSRELGYESAEVLYLIGTAYKNMAEMNLVGSDKRAAYLRQAIEHLEEALQMEPRNFPVLGNLADIHFNAGRYERALALYERAAQIDPGHPLLAARLAHTHLALGNAGKAADLLQKALARLRAAPGPSDSQGQLIALSTEISMRYYLAQALLRLGRQQGARDEFKQVIELGNVTVGGYQLGGTAAEQRRGAQEMLKRLGE